MHINTNSFKALGLTAWTTKVCVLLYDAAAGLGIGPDLMEQGKGMTFSTKDWDNNTFNLILDDDKANPWLKPVKKEAKLLT